MRKKTIKQVLAIANYMLEGNTYDEAAVEFDMKKENIKRIINEQLPYVNPEIYGCLKNKPYMALQRAMYRKISIDQSCKELRLARKRFDDFLREILKEDPKKYVSYRTKIYNLERKIN